MCRYCGDHADSHDKKGKFFHIFNSNLNAPVFLVQSLLFNRKIKNGASFVFISSTAPSYVHRGNGAYAATKGALEAISRTLAKEVYKRHIRSNCIAPAMVDTPLIEAFKIGSQEAMEKDRAGYPLDYGQPSDVAYACVCLLSDASRWITGQVLTMEGGATLG